MDLGQEDDQKLNGHSNRASEVWSQILENLVEGQPSQKYFINQAFMV